MLHERFQVATHRAENIWGDFPKVFLVMAMYLCYTWDILYLVHFLLMSSLSHSKKSRTPWTMPFPSDSTTACERMPARGLLAGRRAGVQPLSARLDMGHSQCFFKRCWVSIPENQSRWIHTSDRKSHGRLADLEGKRWGHHSRTLFHRRLCSPCADRGCPTLPSEVHRLPSGPVPWCNCSIFFTLGHHWSPLQPLQNIPYSRPKHQSLFLSELPTQRQPDSKQRCCHYIIFIVRCVSRNSFADTNNLHTFPFTTWQLGSKLRLHHASFTPPFSQPPPPSWCSR